MVRGWGAASRRRARVLASCDTLPMRGRIALVAILFITGGQQAAAQGRAGMNQLAQREGLVVRGGIHHQRLTVVVRHGKRELQLIKQRVPANSRSTVDAYIVQFLSEPTLYDIRVRVKSRWADGRTQETTSHHVVRRNPLSVACQFAGDRQLRPGRNCGGGGYDRVSAKRVSSGWPLRFALRTQRGGVHYRKHKLRCVPSSPVRSRPIERIYELPRGGSCKLR